MSTHCKKCGAADCDVVVAERQIAARERQMSAPMEERHRRAAWRSWAAREGVTREPDFIDERFIKTGATGPLVSSWGKALTAVAQVLADIEAAAERRGRIAGLKEAVGLAEAGWALGEIKRRIRELEKEAT